MCVVAAVQQCHGAAGCDAWSADEVHMLPEDALRVFYRLVCRWHTAETIPDALTKGRMVHLPKDHQIMKHSIDTKDLRPTTVLVYGGAYGPPAGASVKAPVFGRKHLPSPCVESGICGHFGAEEATAELQDNLVLSQSHLVTLDYSQCYDGMCSNASAIFLRQIGFPSALAKQIASVWNTKRWIQYGDFCHPDPIRYPAVPQGCP